MENKSERDIHDLRKNNEDKHKELWAGIKDLTNESMHIRERVAKVETKIDTLPDKICLKIKEAIHLCPARIAIPDDGAKNEYFFLKKDIHIIKKTSFILLGAAIFVFNWVCKDVWVKIYSHFKV